MRHVFALCLSSTISLIPMLSHAEEAPASYSKAVKAAAPSVVNIYAVRPESDNSDQQSYRQGSGVIMDNLGHILTNYHVSRQAKTVFVGLADGRKTQAKIIGSDPETDLSVIQIPYHNAPPISISDSKKVEVGDIVLAIGNPFGLGQTVTHGIVSAIGRNTADINQYENYIQIDAAINPGNSGGALVNSQGKLVGITVGIYSRTGGFQGVGFAIPVDVALNIMNQIIKKGRIDRAYLGVNVLTLNITLSQDLKIDQNTGVVVAQVIPHSPAADAGLKVNDVILSVNDYQVQNAEGFQGYIADREPGSHLLLKIIRKNKELNPHRHY
jgi:serine peptidase DegS